MLCSLIVVAIGGTGLLSVAIDGVGELIGGHGVVALEHAGTTAPISLFELPVLALEHVLVESAATGEGSTELVLWLVVWVRGWTALAIVIERSVGLGELFAHGILGLDLLVVG